MNDSELLNDADRRARQYIADIDGVVPHYWSMKVFWLFDAGAREAALVHAVVGLGWQGVVLVLLARRFSRIVRQ